jgi:hypothetical protein
MGAARELALGESFRGTERSACLISDSQFQSIERAGLSSPVSMRSPPSGGSTWLHMPPALPSWWEQIWECSFVSSLGDFKQGAGRRIRTDDLLITNQLLYQLSYAGAYERKLTCLTALSSAILHASLTTKYRLRRRDGEYRCLNNEGVRGSIKGAIHRIR